MPGKGAINVLNQVNMARFEWAVYLDVSARSEMGRFARFCTFSVPGRGRLLSAREYIPHPVQTLFHLRRW